MLHARGFHVAQVVTHRDDPKENRWFSSVAETAAELGLPVAYAEDFTPGQLRARLSTLRPDYLFSFYYRHMLPPDVLATARVESLNMHGSLLPKYRGRAPVNWAVLHGETETGATLHVMEPKPDAGDIVAQMAVPILPDDTAREVFDKVTVAAETILWQVSPELLAGRVPRRPNDVAHGSYFGGRRPEDGRIDWPRAAREVHDRVRAVAPPYPGAFTALGPVPVRVLRTWWSAPPALGPAPPGTLAAAGGKAWACCGDGRWLEVREIEIAGEGRLEGAALAARFAPGAVAVGQFTLG